ncbi:MAG TPA: FtsJ-like methyltransferase family protein [Candidatus Binatia bacterium]|nr:FtsJ-like methyltransferase family protein [Candidatus Binatia bacterium]
MTYRRKDAYYRRARAAGYRARSAYKLAEIDARFRLLHPGDRVLDLGAWPGGWLQVALERVGPEGRVVGVDIVPIEPLDAANVALVTGDVRERATLDAAVVRLGGRADILLSDLAPKLSGVRATDEARAAELLDAMLDALPIVLRRGGRLLAKVFMDPGYDAMIDRLRTCFATIRTTRPEATRRGSAELYVVGLNHECVGKPSERR